MWPAWWLAKDKEPDTSPKGTVRTHVHLGFRLGQKCAFKTNFQPFHTSFFSGLPPWEALREHELLSHQVKWTNHLEPLMIFSPWNRLELVQKEKPKSQAQWPWSVQIQCPQHVFFSFYGATLVAVHYLLIAKLYNLRGFFKLNVYTTRSSGFIYCVSIPGKSNTFLSKWIHWKLMSLIYRVFFIGFLYFKVYNILMCNIYKK